VPIAPNRIATHYCSVTISHCIPYRIQDSSYTAQYPCLLYT